MLRSFLDTYYMLRSLLQRCETTAKDSRVIPKRPRSALDCEYAIRKVAVPQTLSGEMTVGVLPVQHIDASRRGPSSHSDAGSIFRASRKQIQVA